MVTQAAPLVQTVTVGPLQMNCYLVVCPQTRQGAIIDPGDEPEHILAAVKDMGMAVRYLLNTHGHIDHISAIDPVQAATGAPLAIHPLDESLYTDQPLATLFGFSSSPVKTKADFYLEEGAVIEFGAVRLEVIYTPGHTQGGVSLVCAPYCVFSGDTLFYRGIGRTDLPGGNHQQLLASIRTKLFPLADDLLVYPGHGPPTTIGEEKEENPFL